MADGSNRGGKTGGKAAFKSQPNQAEKTRVFVGENEETLHAVRGAGPSVSPVTSPKQRAHGTTQGGAQKRAQTQAAQALQIKARKRAQTQGAQAARVKQINAQKRAQTQAAQAARVKQINAQKRAQTQAAKARQLNAKKRANSLPAQPVAAVPLQNAPSRVINQSKIGPAPSPANQNSQALVRQPHQALAVTQGTSNLSEIVPQLASLARRVSIQSKLSNADHVLKRGLSELMSSRRVHIFYRQPKGGLSTTDGLVSAAGSIAHQVMSTRKPIILGRADSHAAYNAESDNPGGDGSEALFAFPIGTMGQALAVCILVRPLHMGRPYGIDEAKIASFVASHVAPAIQLLIAQQTSQALQVSDGASMFRQEALEQNKMGIGDGEVIRISPLWIRSTYRLLISIAVIGMAYLLIARVDESSIGPAIIRVQGDQLTARTGATVSRILVNSGQLVKKDELLVELYSAAEAASLAEIESEYRTKMAAFLLEPGNIGARSGLATVAAQRQRAKTAVSEKSIRAPRAGVIRDLRIREGMPVGPGDHIVTIEHEGTLPEVVALLPGADRPQLAEGMEIKLSIPGYQSLPAEASILEIGTEVIGPAEARRFLGPTLADAVPIEGPVVVVKAQLTSNIFEEGDHEYEFSDGMPLQAEVTLDSESMIAALFGGNL